MNRHFLILTISVVFVGCSEINFFIKADTILLTANPIKLNSDWVTIKPSEPLDIVAEVPNIRVEINRYKQITLDFEKSEEDFNNYSRKFEAEIVFLTGEIVKFNNDSINIYSDNSAVVYIFPSKQLTEYEKKLRYKLLRLRSKIDIPSANIYWTNGNL